MSNIAVTVDGLGKRYRIAHQREPYGRLTESLSRAARAPLERLRRTPRETHEWFWALQDVSFTVKRGTVVGIIGRNGAGKSTLLKILSRITEPSTGAADLDGRVGSLLEVGTGFHPELTGRENIFLSGSILGMRRSEIARRFDEIVAFAEVDQFLDTPVKRYSSGMQVRLGFAVAAYLEPDILIVDEVLAVGDAAFQKKCLAKMGDVSGEGRTILFVSHNMPAVEALCSEAVLLDRGQVVMVAPTAEVIDAYVDQAAVLGSTPLADRGDRDGDGRVRLLRVDATLRTGSDGEIRLGYRADSGVRGVEFAIGLFSPRGEGVTHLSTNATGFAFDALPRAGTISCHIPAVPLIPGIYLINVFCTVNGTIADWVSEAARVEVSPGDLYGTGKLPPHGYGHVLVQHHWSVADG